MRKYTLVMSAILTFVLIASVPSCAEDDDDQQPAPNEYVADNDSFKNFMSWTLTATHSGPDPSLGPAHAGNDSTATRRVYVLNGQDRVDGEFPVGTRIVKHTSNPSGTVNEFTAMVKRGNDYDPNGNDWEYFVLNSDGSIAEDNNVQLRGASLMNGMCQGCHSANASQDYVFSK